MTTESGIPDVSKVQIEVHWREEDYIAPPPKFVEQANANDPAILDRFAEQNFPDCFTEYADLLTWEEPWQTVLDTSNPPFWRWFTGGKLNACYNCVDRHWSRDPNKAALLWVPEPESVEGHMPFRRSALFINGHEVEQRSEHLIGARTCRGRRVPQSRIGLAVQRTPHTFDVVVTLIGQFASAL